MRLIEMVSGRVANYTRQTFDEATSTIKVVAGGDGVVRLPQRPVTAVSSVVYWGATLASSYYEWTEAGYLTRAWPAASAINAADVRDRERAWSATPLTVTYTHGYPDQNYPADIAMVVAEKVAKKWLSGVREAEGTTSESIDGYAAAYQRLSHVTAGKAWDPEHKEVLDFYRGVGPSSLRVL